MLKRAHPKTKSHKSTTCFKLRMTTPLRSKLENDANHCRRIDRLTLMRCWLKSDLLCCFHSLFVQSVSQALQYSNHMHLAAGTEQNFQTHLSVDLQPAPFLGVFRVGLGEDLHRSA